MSFGITECVDITIGQQQAVLDIPGVRMRASDLDEIEPVGRVDPGSGRDESFLQLRVFAQGAFGERMLEQR